MRTVKRLNIHAVVLLILLTVQYVLGMAANLFVQFPNHVTEGQLWEFAWSQTSIAAHIIVGSLLILGALALIIRAIRAKNREWVRWSSIGFLTLLIAGLSGSRFIPTQQGIY